MEIVHNLCSYVILRFLCISIVFMAKTDFLE